MNKLMKSQVNLSLGAMSAAEKVAFANAVAGALIANDSIFDAPPIAGADLMDFATSVSEAITVADAAKATYHSLVQAQNDLVAQLVSYLRQTGSYVQTVSAGDAAIIQLAGLSVRKVPASIGLLNAPVGFVAEPTSNPGILQLKWKPNRHAHAYQVEYSTDSNFTGPSTRMVMGVRSKKMIFGLTSATRYYIRVAAINAAGPSQWSNALTVVTQ